MARILLRHSEEVARCIEMREKEGYKEVDRYYIQKFLNPGSNLEVESETVQSNRIKEWIEGKQNSVGVAKCVIRWRIYVQSFSFLVCYRHQREHKFVAIDFNFYKFIGRFRLNQFKRLLPTRHIFSFIISLISNRT